MGLTIRRPRTASPGPNKRGVPAFLGTVVLAIAFAVAGCTSGGGGAKGTAVSPAGGVVRVSDGVRVKVAAGALRGTTIRDETIPAAPAYPADAAAPVGHAVEIVPSGPLPASTILMSFNPATDLPRAKPGVAAPTAGNAFIAVLDKQKGTWVPLATTYDAATHQLAAVAPHFTGFQTFVMKPGKYVFHTVAGAVSVVVKAGESGLSAAESLAEGVWDQYKPEFGTGLRRSLPADEEIDNTCSGSDPGLPWDTSYGIYVNNDNMKVRSCVVDEGAQPDEPSLLMENDYGFPVDVIPQEKGATLPALSVGDHPDQDLVAALNSAIGFGYIPGPGVTRIRFPEGPPPTFAVSARADWLGLATDIIMTSAAIIPGFEAETTRFTAELENVTTTLEKDGQAIESQSQVLKITQTRLKAEKGPAVEGADNLASAYICFADLSSISLQDSAKDLTGKVTGCLKELFGKPGDGAISAGSITSEYLSYLDAVVSFIKLPAVLDDFREHGRQTFLIDAARKSSLTYTGFIKQFTPQAGTLSFDQALYFTGPSAYQVCVEWHVPIHDGEECHDYYLQDLKEVRTLPLSASVTVEAQDPPGSVSNKPVTLSRLAQLMEQPGVSDQLFQFTVIGGQVTDISAIYRP